METVFLWTLVDLLEGSELAIGVAVLLCGIWIYMELSRTYSTPWSFIMVVFGCLFIVAKITQATLLGPTFIRHHLTDVGFIPLVALLTFLLRNHHLKLKSRGNRAVWFAVLLAFIPEVLQMYFKYKSSVSDVIPTGPTAMGDWWDMIIFVVMTPITFWLMSKHTWTLANRIAEQQCKFKMNGIIRTNKIKQLLDEIY